MKKYPGFTLIELLVVIAITVVFVGASLAGYNTFTEQTKLKNEAKKLIDVIELAKKKASSADLGQLTCNGVFLGYEVDIGANSYTLNLRCAGPPTSQLTATYNFPNLNIYTLSGAGLFRFKQLTLGLEYKTIESAEPTPPPIIQIKNLIINKCVNITISAFGIIELDEGLVNC